MQNFSPMVIAEVFSSRCFARGNPVAFGLPPIQVHSFARLPLCGKQYIRRGPNCDRHVQPRCAASVPLYKPSKPTRVFDAVSPSSTTSATPPSPRKRAKPPGVVIIPGYGSPATEYFPLRDALIGALGSGAVVQVAHVTVATWARTLGGRPVTPVLELVDEAVSAVRELCSGRVTLVGHSAGGWIGRIWLSRTAEYYGRVWKGADKVDTLICLGTPQQSSEPVTMKNMTFVNQFVPSCAESPHVTYVCVAGSALAISESDVEDKFWKLRFWDTARWFARLSYELTDASASSAPCIGDGTFLLLHDFAHELLHLQVRHRIYLTGYATVRLVLSLFFHARFVSISIFVRNRAYFSCLS